MLTNDLEHLLMMQPVRINHNIAKGHRDDIEINTMLGFTFDADMEQRNKSLIWDGVDFKIPESKNKLVCMLIDVYANLRLLISEPRKKDVVKIFETIKDSIREEKIDKQIVEEYSNFVEENYSEFQVMLEHSAQYKKNLLTKEIAASEEYKSISESELIKFILKCERGLVMDELYFYRRAIPQSVQKSIKTAIEKKIFDNVYILYYDNTPSPFFMTLSQDKRKNAEELEKKLKDPIAFGVIFGSDKLFFIDDWEDEFCNLKFSDITDFLESNRTCEESDAV